ncbi:hypothetical protein N9W34_02240 [Rickettsiales bacterium]|nr:hypothetical protein [Rickettsiales bacterium]
MTENKPYERRTESEKVQVGDYFKGDDRYYDQIAEVTVVKVFSGDCYVSDKPGEMMVTVLGSCIAACIRDPIAKVGGMNHFLLPDSSGHEGASTRYGAYAMEELINGILKKGGKKERLEVKVFGGGNVMKSSALIGTKNITFIRKYLKDEGIPIAMEHLGGTTPRRVHYYSDTGKVMMRALRREDDYENVKKEELEYKHNVDAKTKTDKTSDVELF